MRGSIKHYGASVCRRFHTTFSVSLSLLVCTSAGVQSAVAQDHPDSSWEIDPACSPWEFEPACSEGESLRINGISLYYEERGRGEPLLLLGGSAEHYNRMLPELTKHYRVITPDPRAQGRSTDTDEPLTYRQIVDDMVDLLDSLGIDSAYVGGWSDGAGMAMRMAIWHPERVRALLLTAVDLSLEGQTETLREDAKGWDLNEKVAALWFDEPSPPTDDELAGIRAPALFVIGENEQYVKLDHVAWQYEAIPDAEVVWIPGADHFLVINQPNEVNEAILSFLDRNR